MFELKQEKDLSLSPYCLQMIHSISSHFPPLSFPELEPKQAQASPVGYIWLAGFNSFLSFCSHIAKTAKSHQIHCSIRRLSTSSGHWEMPCACMQFQYHPIPFNTYLLSLYPQTFVPPLEKCWLLNRDCEILFCKHCISFFKDVLKKKIQMYLKIKGCGNA